MGAAWAAETKARTERASRRIGRVFDGKRNSAAVAANVRAVQEALDGLHIGLSIFDGALRLVACNRTRSEEHTSELQSLMRISYAVFCLKKKKPQRATDAACYP